ncbi:hypothetical protein B5807_09284 [Epicoccum nigrum]|uniref:Uncharacterized protein n=1 Tax=Epicoccum nigrum TaxID=105696 RepID=A0A1Y2LMK3_EPING|nr:hypothetical protein B5807_09284 [Epicoccum nigrum]
MASPLFPDADALSHSQDLPHPFAQRSSATAHWYGNAETLFRLSPRTKRGIQDYILGACASRDKEHNEQTKPTGSKLIYILNLDDSVEEQPTLCVLSSVVTFTDTHNVNDAQGRGYINEQTAARRSTANDMTSNSTPGALRRRGSTVSFTKMLASASNRNFPHDDLELDSDPDSDSDSDPSFDETSPLPLLDAIEEAEEEEEGKADPVPTTDHVIAKYCRDPYSPAHPTCHSRTKSLSYAHLAGDAEADLQQRFAMKHDGEDSAAHYLNWQVLKWEYGQTMVHGPSSLRREVPISAVDGAAEQLTARGGESGAPTRRGDRCSDGCAFEADGFIGGDAEVGVWVVHVDEGGELVSETSTLFGGVVSTGRDAEADMARGESPTRIVRTLSEEALLKASHPARLLPDDADTVRILDTSHDEFVEHYIHRQQALRSRSSAAAIPQAEARKPACHVPVGAPHTCIDAAPVPARHVVQATLPPTPDVSPARLTAALEAHSVRTLTQPAHSSSESLSVPPSVFTHSTSVTTKPSQESVGEEHQRKIIISLPPRAFAPQPRPSRRLKAEIATKKCLRTVRGTVQRGVDGVSVGAREMRKAMRGALWS